MKSQPLDRRALGLALTRIANATANDAIAGGGTSILGYTARRIGITGAPGSGKSSLAGRLAQLRCSDKRLGVLAIDPSSPKSGGAILGDRIRMDELAGLGDLYIRSFGSRSASDGLTDNLPELLDTMDAFGFDEVILETVGVGQVEYAARAQVDTLVLVLLPESGDFVQAMKAGIMEMADVFVVNKCDLPGANKMAAEIKRILPITQAAGPDRWAPPVLLTSIEEPESIAALSEQIGRHGDWLDRRGKRNGLVQERARYRLQRLVEREAARIIAGLGPSFFNAPIAEQYHAILDKLDARRTSDRSA